jgi:hypothetical protein
MDVVVRLILRFFLIPLGYLAAVIAGTLVILFGPWGFSDIGKIADPDAQAVAIIGLVLAGPILLVALVSIMWLPSAIGILLSEAFALRSWIYHAGNGAVSAWLGWHLFGQIDPANVPLNEPLHVIAAGLAGGFAYWAVAGFSAGFWKPVFARAEPVAPGAAGAATPR